MSTDTEPEHPQYCRCGAHALAETLSEVALADEPRSARQNFVSLTLSRLDARWGALVRHSAGAGVRFVTYSDPMVAGLARVVRACREGPCWDLVRESQVVVADDLVTDGRWPQLVTLVSEQLPVRAALAVPMRLDEETPGGFVVYSDRAGWFDRRRVHDALLLARHAELCLALVRSRAKSAHLEQALQTNRTIGMALGIIMDRERVTEEQAHDILSTASQRSHIKLRELAARVVETGELPRAGRELAR